MPRGPNAVAVRALVPDEWRTVRELRLAALADAAVALGSDPELALRWTERQWRGWPARGVPLVAFRANQPVGLVGVIPATADPSTADLVALWVVPDARGGGVGDALVEAVAALARDWGCRWVRLDVLATNHPAIRLYRRHGFELLPERLRGQGTPRTDPPASPPVTMRRSLPTDDLRDA